MRSGRRASISRARWEFPGGKLEPGERRVAGLARELKEEIGITIGQPRPLMRLRHVYSYGEVLLDVWVVRRYSGEPESLDNQPLRWCGLDELADADLLPADQPIIGLLRLPERLTRSSTPFYRVGNSSLAGEGTKASPSSMLLGISCKNAAEAVAAAVGSDFLVMRESISDSALTALCDELALPVFALGMTLERAWSLGASGINAIVC